MKLALASVFAACILGVGAASQASTLDDVKAKGRLACAVNLSVIGFAATDDAGKWHGLDIDLCSAVSAAVLGDPSKVDYTPVSGKDRFTVLQNRSVDITGMHSTLIMSRVTALGLEYTATSFFGQQSFMVRKSLGVTSANQLDGATVCVETGSTTELAVADYFRAHNMHYEALAVASSEEALRAYDALRCDVLTNSAVPLAAARLKFADPEDSIILPEAMQMEPLGMFVRQGDPQWANIVRWTVYALMAAEEMGITQANIDDMRANSTNPNVRRLLGVENETGSLLGLDADWSYRAIKAVGNYGEVFERDLGSGSPLKTERGLNALWTSGGLMYAPPIR